MFFQCFYLCIGCPGSFCYGWAFSSSWKQGLLSRYCVQASHCGDFSCSRGQALNASASVTEAHRLSCSAVCGILPDQGANLCLLRWQADSYPLFHLGSPWIYIELKELFQFSSVQLLSHVWLFATPWTAARQAFRSIIISQNLLKLMSITSVMPSNHLILCRSLLLPPSIFPSIRVFSNESALCIR